MISDYFCSLCWVIWYSNPFFIFGFLYLIHMLQFIHMLQPTLLYKIYYLLAKVTHSYENSRCFCLYSDLDFKNYLLDTWGIFGKVLEVIHSVMVFWLVDENICPFCWLTHIIFGRKVFPWNRIGRQQQGTALWGDFL